MPLPVFPRLLVNLNQSVEPVNHVYDRLWLPPPAVLLLKKHLATALTDGADYIIHALPKVLKTGRSPQSSPTIRFWHARTRFGLSSWALKRTEDHCGPTLEWLDEGHNQVRVIRLVEHLVEHLDSPQNPPLYYNETVECSSTKFDL